MSLIKKLLLLLISQVTKMNRRRIIKTKQIDDTTKNKSEKTEFLT